MIRYPRTPHLQGSRLQPGDEDLAMLPWAVLDGRSIVVEEKMDGANSGISFDAEGRLVLQSRGHPLQGGPRERQFAMLKTWASRHREALFRTLGTRWLMYGEWMYARHTIYYDTLQHWFLEFDVLDKETGAFLGTSERRALLEGLPVVSVPVLLEGIPENPRSLPELITRSRFQTEAWREELRLAALESGADPVRALTESDDAGLAEGLYVKVEEGGHVVARMKWVRHGFTTAVQDSGSHWMNRPIIPNRLAAGCDLFADPS